MSPMHPSRRSHPSRASAPPPSPTHPSSPAATSQPHPPTYPPTLRAQPSEDNIAGEEVYKYVEMPEARDLECVLKALVVWLSDERCCKTTCASHLPAHLLMKPLPRRYESY